MMLDLSLNFSRNRMVDGGGETIRNGSKPMNKQHDKMVEAATKWLAKNDTVGMSAQQAMSGFAEPFATALRALVERRKHIYWGAGEPDCPRELKAANGELHTLRCKVCGQNSPKDYCGYMDALAQAKALLADTPLTGE
jgi:hypothetical protein